MGRRRRKATRAAADTARAGVLPQLQEGRRQRREAGDLYDESVAANEAGYGALDRSLSKIGRYYTPAYNKINRQYNRSVGGLSDLMGGAGSMGSLAAFGGAAGTAAINGVNQIRGQQSIGQTENLSRRRQGAIEEKTNSMNFLDEYRDTLDEVTKYMRDVRAQEAANKAALIPQYQQQYFENAQTRKATALAQRQMELTEAEAAQARELEEWYQSYLQNQYGAGANPQPAPQPQQVPIPPRMQGHPTGGFQPVPVPAEGSIYRPQAIPPRMQGHPTGGSLVPQPQPQPWNFDPYAQFGRLRPGG